MGSLSLVITNRVKLELSLGSVVIRSTENGDKTIPIENINILIVEMPGVAITGALLSELISRKVKVIFCDEKHNPQFECVPYYGTSDTSSKVRKQIKWSDDIKNCVWKRIVELKIFNQAFVLKAQEATDSYNMLMNYIKDIEPGDITNREGHAAKVYFNTLFGVSFSRRQDIPLNAKLNYGYSLLLSMCSREITSLGYITQLGVFHDNGDNEFNFACDMMEPFRPIVDSIVIKNFLDGDLDSNTKKQLIEKILDVQVLSDGKIYKLSYSISMFVQSVVSALESGEIDIIKNFEYEY